MTNQPRPFQKGDKVSYTVKSSHGKRDIAVVCTVLDFYYNYKEFRTKKKGWVLLLLREQHVFGKQEIEKNWDKLKPYYEKNTK